MRYDVAGGLKDYSPAGAYLDARQTQFKNALVQGPETRAQIEFDNGLADKQKTLEAAEAAKSAKVGMAAARYIARAPQGQATALLQSMMQNPVVRKFADDYKAHTGSDLLTLQDGQLRQQATQIEQQLAASLGEGPAAKQVIQTPVDGTTSLYDPDAGTASTLVTGKPKDRSMSPYEQARIKNETDRIALERSRIGMRDMPKPGAGQRVTPDGQLEFVPNTPQYVKAATKHAKDLSQSKMAALKASIGLQTISEILAPENKEGFDANFGGYNARVTSKYPSALNVKAKISSLKSAMKNAGLEFMRTGGSIGQMTLAEWPIVESMLAEITSDIDEPEAIEKLQQVAARLQAIYEVTKSSYDSAWKDSQFYEEVKLPGAGGGGKTPRSFATEAEAEASGVKGVVIINGRKARID